MRFLKIAIVSLLCMGANFACQTTSTKGNLGASVPIPNEFSPGTAILSADMNANFRTIYLNCLAPGSIDTEQYADLSVTAPKIGPLAVIAGKIGVGAIFNNDVNGAAAISGAKIIPNFGAQNVVTTGNATVHDATVGGDLNVTGASSVGSFTMATGAVNNYTLTSDGSGNGTWQNTAAGMVPVGSMVEWGTATPPSGWLICDGTAVSRTTYSTLYGIIGTTYGVGNGSTTFNLPNWSGRMGIGVNGTYTLASTGGAATHSHSSTLAAPSHTHTDTLAAPAHTHGTTDNQNGSMYAAIAGNSSDYLYFALRYAGSQFFTGTRMTNLTYQAFSPGVWSAGVAVLGVTAGASATALSGSVGAESATALTGSITSTSSLPPYLATYKIIKF
jgi:microcystin-dependent protein